MASTQADPLMTLNVVGSTLYSTVIKAGIQAGQLADFTMFCDPNPNPIPPNPNAGRASSVNYVLPSQAGTSLYYLEILPALDGATAPATADILFTQIDVKLSVYDVLGNPLPNPTPVTGLADGNLDVIAINLGLK